LQLGEPSRFGLFGERRELCLQFFVGGHR
jgi:hypothetical protein